MKTLKEKILLLDLKPRNAPDGIKVDTFGKWIRAVKRGEDVGEIATAFLHLYCDGRLNTDTNLIVRSNERSIAVSDDIHIAVSHLPVNCMPGTFTTKDGVLVFNLDGTFWTGGSDGMVSINGVAYEYPVGKKFGNFKKVK